VDKFSSLLKAVDSGNCSAMGELGHLYVFSKEAKYTNILDGIVLIRNAVELGCVSAMCDLGMIYRSVFKVSDDTKAIYWFKRAGDLGSNDGNVHLWKLYKVRGMEEKMIEYCVKAAKGGHLESIKNAGGYFRGKKAHSKAIEMYQLGVDLNDRECLFRIASIYEDLKDYLKAVEWFEKIVQRGKGKYFASGYWHLGKTYRKMGRMEEAIRNVCLGHKFFVLNKNKQECLDFLKEMMRMMSDKKLVEYFSNCSEKEDRIRELEEKVGTLQTELDFRPGGNEEKKLETHFYEVASMKC